MRAIIFVAALASMPCLAQAQGPSRDTNRPLASLFACLGRQVESDRLSCLEEETLKLQKSERNRDLVVVDRDRAKALKLLRVDEESGAKRLPETFEGSLVAASRVQDRWMLDAGVNGRWIQADGTELGRTPRVGDRMRLRRGPVGGYLTNLANGPAFRVRPYR